MQQPNDTIILIRPHRDGWESFESPGVQPYFPERRMAIGTPANCGLSRKSKPLLPD
jgi:hypothetical protein